MEMCFYVSAHKFSTKKLAAVQLVKDQALMTPLHIFPRMVRYICRYPVLISSLTEILAALKYCWCQLCCMLWRLCTKWPCMMTEGGNTVNLIFQKTLKCKCRSDENFISGCTRNCHCDEMQKIYFACIYRLLKSILVKDKTLPFYVVCAMAADGWWWVIICGIDPIYIELFRYEPDFFSDQKWSIKTFHYKPFVWKILSFCRLFQHVFLIFYCIYF